MVGFRARRSLTSPSRGGGGAGGAGGQAGMSGVLCIPGASRLRVHRGRQGAQVCNAGGSSFGACICLRGQRRRCGRRGTRGQCGRLGRLVAGSAGTNAGGGSGGTEGVKNYVKFPTPNLAGETTTGPDAICGFSSRTTPSVASRRQALIERSFRSRPPARRSGPSSLGPTATSGSPSTAATSSAEKRLRAWSLNFQSRTATSCRWESLQGFDGRLWFTERSSGFRGHDDDRWRLQQISNRPCFTLLLRLVTSSTGTTAGRTELSGSRT